MILSTNKIALSHFLQNPFRSAGLSILIALFSAVLLSGLLFTFGLDRGLSKISGKLGADAVILPTGAQVESGGLLLQGGTSSGDLPRELLEFVQSSADVVAATPQSFFTTVGANCCDKKVNIIGFDSKTDFVVRPWIQKVYQKEWQVGDVIVGSNLQIGEKGTVRFFDKEFRVVAQLEPLGGKLDQSVFTDEETLWQIRKAAEEKGYRFLNEKNGISAILLKLHDGVDIDKFSQEIHSRFDWVQIQERRDMYAGLSHAFQTFRTFFLLIAGFFFVISLIAVSIVFSLSTNERKEEFAVIRMVGGTRSTLRRIVFAESLLISGTGTFSGVAFGFLAFFLFRLAVSDGLEIPLELPGFSAGIFIFAVSVFLSLLLGPLAALRSAWKIGKLDIYAILRGNAK